MEELQVQLRLSKDTIAALQNDIGMRESAVCSAITEKDKLVHFYCETKSGKHYSAAIRKLYYNFLADHIPPAKVSQTILKYMLPYADLSQLKLPGENCAGYMRASELETISMAHKATHFSEVAQAGALNLNSDGTTLHQRKIGATILSGTVVSINELPEERSRC